MSLMFTEHCWGGVTVCSGDGTNLLMSGTRVCSCSLARSGSEEQGFMKKTILPETSILNFVICQLHRV